MVYECLMCWLIANELAFIVMLEKPRTMNWQVTLILAFILCAIAGAMWLVWNISTGIWHGQLGWIAGGIALVAFFAWFVWGLRI